MNAIALAMVSVLIPAKMWFAPDQPINIDVKPDAGAALTLMLTDFSGRGIEPQGPADVAEAKTVDVKQIFSQVTTPGTYILYAVPKGKSVSDFVGTPLVIGV